MTFELKLLLKPAKKSQPYEVFWQKPNYLARLKTDVEWAANTSFISYSTDPFFSF